MNLIAPILQLNLLGIWKREVRVWGYNVTPPSLDRLVCLALHRLSLMGTEEKKAFGRWLQPGMTVVDIGANQGLYSLLFSGLVGRSGAVLSFEPESDMFAALVHNCEVNAATNVECFNMALGSSVGTGTLHRSLVHGGDNRIATGLNENITKCIEVKMTTLDAIIGARKIDFIKMDVQGWEWEVFQGMRAVLDHNPDIQIYFEFWPQGLRNAGADPEAVLRFLIGRGFRLSQTIKGAEAPLQDTALGKNWKGQRFTNIYARR